MMIYSFDSKKLLSSSKRKYKISYLAFNICVTFSPIASDDVKPGDSIPNKLNHPGSPNSNSLFDIKITKFPTCIQF